MSSDFGFGPMSRQTRQHSWYSNISKRWFFSPLSLFSDASSKLLKSYMLNGNELPSPSARLPRKCCHDDVILASMSAEADCPFLTMSIDLPFQFPILMWGLRVWAVRSAGKNMESIRDVQRHLLWKSFVSRTDWCQEGLGLGKSWGSKINNQRVETPSKWFKVMTKKHGTLPSLFRSIAIGVLEKRAMSKMEESWHLFFWRWAFRKNKAWKRMPSKLIALDMPGYLLLPSFFEQLSLWEIVWKPFKIVPGKLEKNIKVGAPMIVISGVISPL